MISVGSTKILPYERALINKVLDSNQISPGPFVLKFESQFSNIHQIKHAAFVSSGTDALRIALLALKEKYGWKDGSKVLVPAVTFVATINVVLQCNLVPVLVDINPYDYGINHKRIELSELRYVGLGKYEEHVNIGEEAKEAVCIIIAHLFGQCVDVEPILESARHYGWKVIEDSCETMFVKYKGQMVGTFGDISCFSTYACHMLSTGVGGLACTQDDELNGLIRSYANHGRDIAYIPGYSKPTSTEDFIDRHFKYDRIGYSSRATELQAALGLGQLKVWKENMRKRQANANYLTNHLEQWRDYIWLPYPMVGREHGYMMYPILINANDNFTRKELMLYLAKSGIESRYMMPIQGQPCYKEIFYRQPLPMAHLVDQYGFYIGCHPELTKRDLEKIVAVFEKFFRGIDKKRNLCK